MRILDHSPHAIAGGALLATLVLWGQTALATATLRANVAGADWGPGAIDATTLASQAWLEETVSVFASFRAAGLITMALLLLRLFWLFSLQPRLAVLSVAIGRSVSDLMHFGLVFGAILVFFGIWGYTSFGAQSYKWSTPIASVYGARGAECGRRNCRLALVSRVRGCTMRLAATAAALTSSCQPSNACERGVYACSSALGLPISASRPSLRHTPAVPASASR
jgi:hypothetical protein